MININNSSNSINPKSTTIQKEITDTRLKIEKLNKAKNNRKILTVFGAILLFFYIFIFGYAYSITSNDASSVSFLGPIFLFPIMLLGILFLIVGISGLFIVSSKILKAEKNIRLLSDVSGSEY
jgi:uncharacterized integral membrane protein